MSLNLDIDSLPPEQVEAAITRLEAVKAQRAAENKLAHYRPYPKQAAFHEAGAKHRERLLSSAKQCAVRLSWRFTSPAIIRSGGMASALTSRCERGLPASPQRPRATFYRRG